MTVRRRMHLAAVFPGTDDTTGWPGPPGDARLAFPALERLARIAERGLFDFLLLDEGQRLPEHRGRVHDLEPAGRPEPVAALNALADVTTRLGLAATVGAGFAEPYELARRIATLDQLSAGRAAWRVATGGDPRAGENFRGGARPEHPARTAELVAAVRLLWDSWSPEGTPRPFAHQGRHFDIAGEFGLPRSPQGRPVLIQAGESEAARELAAASADVFLTRHGSPEAARFRYRYVTQRLAAYGRTPADLRIMPTVTVVLGDTDAEAQERAADIRRQRVTPHYTRYALERLWGRDLSGHDPDGPLPEAAPRGRDGETLALVERWRALAAEKGLSSRETVIEASGRQSFVGSPETVAAALHTRVREGAADGFVLAARLTADGLAEFADRVVPLLQERGAFRTEYEGTTLRSHLALSHRAAGSRPHRRGNTA
ncbi:NtaA/DmoA family FMN-dependent monooxygenase [Streptomyces sp. LP11]|uniref:NtaA/DmoA family FMN-dependent monooxygenase n=1 Tax=Streptomyces pyxinicus TaxID=2970331 RepID=A0ABT2B0S6_9ACTN|nr:NtaA/DmoA family FMN-dependent monooxygenase [Streptomyces sp. LP11]MCS0602057.1 NtaA/DmoA family FMN-dependent monooxygenase [Streptomyces sp. LP11]